MSVYHYVSDNWLNALALVHVLAAIVGIGPTYFTHVLLRKGQTLGQLRHSVKLAKTLEFFPKILGSLAVVTGLLLAWLGDNYGFDLFWIYGAIVLYVLIQIVVIGFMAPQAARATALLQSSKDDPDGPASPDIVAAIARTNAITYVASFLGVLLFLFMFFKPDL